MSIRFLSFTFLLLFAASSIQANHITGGDFTVQHIEGNTFLARLVLYRDCNSGGAPLDQVVQITVFDAVTNEHLPELDFTFNGFESVFPELGNTCFTPDICLEIGIYEMEITLPDNPNGYYLSKERCCRNELSLNLAGANLGFVFTVDVPDPALQNSSPQFGPYPTEAYLCVNGTNQFSFGATDADGDSLVYKFTDPLNGESSDFDPNPAVATAKPYSTIPWAVGYSVDNQVGGANPMTIDSETGLITAQPDLVGVFTIAVEVEEYRDGVLIGKVRRELQLTSTVCTIDLPSVINTPNGDTVFDVLANSSFCIPLEILDPNEGDELFVEAEGPEGFTLIDQELCWTPVCENLQIDPFIITVSAFSEGCANEVLITEQDIYINVFVEPDLPTNLASPQGGEVTIDLYDPSSHCFDFTFVDPNQADTLSIRPISDLFDLPTVTALEPDVQQGTLTFPFCWEVTCEDVRDEPYFINFEVIATNCDVSDTVYFEVPITVVVPEDEEAQFIEPTLQVTWEFYESDTFCMPVTLIDPNFFDTLQVTASSTLLDRTTNPALFDTLDGLSTVSGNFCWAPSCEDVRPEPYVIEFTGTSFSCKTDETVNYTIELFLVLPPESPPVFEVPLPGFSIEHFIGDDSIEFDVLATDPNPYDTLTLTAESILFTEAVNPPIFEGFVNNETVFSPFSWIPKCEDVSEDIYIVSFFVNSKSCQKDVTTQLDVPIFVTTPTKGEIEPIQNIFTPNEDGRNDVWTIEDQEDPCLLNFNTVVFDRWGKEVFQTNDPGFEWNGQNSNEQDYSEGVYYRVIQYLYVDRQRSFTGNVTLSR